jgi:hypothetical protein
LPAAEHNDPLSGLDAFASLGSRSWKCGEAGTGTHAGHGFPGRSARSPATETPVSKPTAPAAAPTPQSEANDKMELAKLYLEMGDKETAEALMKEAGQTV